MMSLILQLYNEDNIKPFSNFKSSHFLFETWPVMLLSNIYRCGESSLSTHTYMYVEHAWCYLVNPSMSLASRVMIHIIYPHTIFPIKHNTVFLDNKLEAINVKHARENCVCTATCMEEKRPQMEWSCESRRLFKQKIRQHVTTCVMIGEV